MTLRLTWSHLVAQPLQIDPNVEVPVLAPLRLLKVEHRDETVPVTMPGCPPLGIAEWLEDTRDRSLKLLLEIGHAVLGLRSKRPGTGDGRAYETRSAGARRV
jgi:hypothetical protein